MKIVRKGYFDKEGIFFTCGYCNGLFLIEGREDFTTRTDKNLFDQSDVVHYSAKCPMCGEYSNLGYIDSPSYMYSGYNHLRHREDWDERFKVNPKEVRHEML